MVLAGGSGAFVLRGTGSSGLLALLGAVLFVVGLLQAGATAGGGGPSEGGFVDADRDAEQMEEYERSKRELAAKNAKALAAKKAKETSDLIAATPGAQERIDAILSAAGALTQKQAAELRADLAKRLHAEQQATSS